MWRTPTLTILAVSSISGCSPRIEYLEAQTECVIFAPIYGHPDDELTDRTKRRIVAHNEKGGALCDWTPPENALRASGAELDGEAPDDGERQGAEEQPAG